MTRPPARIIAHLVMRNELGRYLRPCLREIRQVVDEVVVYDDQSDDGSFEAVQEMGICVGRRPDPVPSFHENEGLFRQAGWDFMEAQAKPAGGDWILSIDADEFLVGNNAHVDVAARLTELVNLALSRNIEAWNIPVGEVFELRANADRLVPQLRIDGLWGRIIACRFVRWRPGGVFDPKVEACGSLPKAWLDGHFNADGLTILHLGYAQPADRDTRFERYRSGRGHNLNHVNSIVSTPHLTPWTGPVPELS